MSSASSSTTQKNQQATNKWIGPIRETVTGKVDSPYLRTTSIPPSGTLSQLNYQDLPGFEGWRIRIVRTTPESLTSFLKNPTFVDSLTEIYGTTLLYPYSSMIYSQFDARSFSRIPSRAYDAKLIKVKVPNNYDPVLKTYGKSDSTTSHEARTGSTIWTAGLKEGGTLDDSFWDGEFKKSYWVSPGTVAANEKTNIQGTYFREWTDNPAWCFYDLLTNPRYGLGEYIKESEIDKWALYEIAQYCDVLVPDSYGSMEPRFTINYVITSREEAYKVMNDLASIFRGMTFYANGSIFAVQDKYKTATYQFNNSNVVDGNFTYASSSKKARHTVAIVRYNDKKDLFQPALEYVENEEAVRRYGIRELETTALGCTSRGQARRFAQWILASEADETETVTFTAGQEGAYLQPGDVVQIYDNFRSPLKYSGRTNAVIPGVKQLTTSAPFPTSPDEMIPASGNNFNSIILDQALNFEKRTVGEATGTIASGKEYQITIAGTGASGNDFTQRGAPNNNVGTIFTATSSGTITTGRAFLLGSNLYKFSLLTPTYNYDANTTSLDTTDEKELRRSQIQNLVFSGAHVRNVTGSYRSDYMEGGSGVCTQIFFNTGTLFGGSGNVLNFYDYVITGYTNTGVFTSKVENPAGVLDAPLSESYSGGCFSGENLIWSIEPDNSNDTEFISGNFSNFRLINIKENEGNKYDVSALAYSTGKYDKIENAVKLGGENLEKLPIFNTGLAVDTTVLEVNTASFSLKDGLAYSETTNLSDYVTLDIKFSAAGYERTLDKSNTGKANGIEDANDDFQYIICKFDYASRPTDDSSTQYENNAAITVSSTNYRQKFLPFVVETINGLASADNPRYKNDQFHSEILVTSTVQKYYIVIFAISAQGVLSQGFGKIIDFSTKATPSVFSIVDNILINSLKTEGSDGEPRYAPSPDVDKQFLTPLSIEAAQPGFTWNASVKGILSAEPPQPTNPTADPSYDLFVPQDSTEYRITIREPSDPKNPNKPSNKIYVEITGYNTQTESPSFVFNEIYNNPNLISGVADDGTTSTGYLYDPHVTGWKDGSVINGWTQLQTNAWKDEQQAEWLSISGSGFNIVNKPNDFPIRSYDLVVEAHDGEGNTSAGNKVFENTLFKNAGDAEQSQEAGFDPNNINKTYDILGVFLAPPESVFYTQITGEEGNWNKRTQYLSPENAYLNDLPYLAQAHIYPDGWLQTTMLLSESTTGTIVEIDGVVQDEIELETRFNNAEGMVYYYTTGDNSVIYVDEKDDDGNVTTSNPQLANPAPAFNIDVENVTFLNDNTNAGTVQQLSKVGDDNIAFGGIVNAGNASNINQSTNIIENMREYVITIAGSTDEGNNFITYSALNNNVGTTFTATSGGIITGSGRAKLTAPQGNVHRGFYLFSDSNSMEALRIPFPHISRPKVQNIQLSYALFDELHLLSAFESDGATPRTTRREPSLITNVTTVKNIFTEKNMNFSKATFPLVSDSMFVKDTNTNKPQFAVGVVGASQSIYLSESSVQSGADAALAFRAWGSINIIRGGALRRLGIDPTVDFKDAILGTEWPDNRPPMVLKTFTTSDIQSITSKFGGYGLVRIILTLKVPPTIDKDKMAVIANGYYPIEGITCTVDVDTHSVEGSGMPSTSDRLIQLTYKFTVTEYTSGSLRHTVGGGWTEWLHAENEDSANPFTLFFGILATDE